MELQPLLPVAGRLERAGYLHVDPVPGEAIVGVESLMLVVRGSGAFCPAAVVEVGPAPGRVIPGREFRAGQFDAVGRLALGPGNRGNEEEVRQSQEDGRSESGHGHLWSLQPGARTARRVLRNQFGPGASW